MEWKHCEQAAYRTEAMQNAKRGASGKHEQKKNYVFKYYMSDSSWCTYLLYVIAGCDFYQKNSRFH